MQITPVVFLHFEELTCLSALNQDSLQISLSFPGKLRTSKTSYRELCGAIMHWLFAVLLVCIGATQIAYSIEDGLDSVSVF